MRYVIIHKALITAVYLYNVQGYWRKVMAINKRAFNQAVCAAEKSLKKARKLLELSNKVSSTSTRLHNIYEAVKLLEVVSKCLNNIEDK